MLTSPSVPANDILEGMDLTSRVLVVLGFAAGAVAGAMTVAALLLAVGMDVHGVAAQLLLAVGGTAGAVVGARANIASGRLLLAERTTDLA